VGGERWEQGCAASSRVVGGLWTAWRGVCVYREKCKAQEAAKGAWEVEMGAARRPKGKNADTVGAQHSGWNSRLGRCGCCGGGFIPSTSTSTSS
jgi:hypothetical protein